MLSVRVVPRTRKFGRTAMKTKKAGGKIAKVTRRAKVGRRKRRMPGRKDATPEPAQIHQNIYAAELNRA